MGWVTGDPDSTALLAIAQAGFNTVLFGTSDNAATLAPVLENVNADGLKAIVSFKASMSASGMQTVVSTIISSYPAAAAAVIAWVRLR